MLFAGLSTTSGLYYNQYGGVKSGDDKSIKHTVIELDPQDYTLNISQEDGIKIINQMGYSSEDYNFELLKHKNWNKTYWKINLVNKEVIISIDAYTGDILYIFDNRDSGPLDVDRNIDQDNLVSIAVGIINNVFDFPENTTEPSINIEEENGEKYYDVEWKQTLGEIQVVNSFLSVSLTKEGHLRSLNNIWYPHLEKQTADISSDQALSIAEGLVENLNLTGILKERIKNAKSKKIELVYKRPEYLLNESRPRYGKEIELVYSINYTSDEGTVIICIDAETGDYRGINYSKRAPSESKYRWIYYGIPILIGIIIVSYLIYNKERAKVLKRKRHDKLDGEEEEEEWVDLLESVK